MKNIPKIIILLIAHNGFSQTIVPIENRRATTEMPGNTYYYQDVNGVLNKYLGGWIYKDNPTSPTKIVEITFYKMERYLSGLGYFFLKIIFMRG